MTALGSPASVAAATLACLIALAGCDGMPLVSRSFVVGDCVMIDVQREAWERPPVITKILEVGKRSYRGSMWLSDSWSLASDTIRFSESWAYRKVECPR